MRPSSPTFNDVLFEWMTRAPRLAIPLPRSSNSPTRRAWERAMRKAVVYSTPLMTLGGEVYYRYAQITGAR